MRVCRGKEIHEHARIREVQVCAYNCTHFFFSSFCDHLRSSANEYMCAVEHVGSLRLNVCHSFLFRVFPFVGYAQLAHATGMGVIKPHMSPHDALVASGVATHTNSGSSNAYTTNGNGNSASSHTAVAVSAINSRVCIHRAAFVITCSAQQTLMCSLQ